MQTFSNLQRKSINVISLKYILFAILLIIYEMLSTTFKLPPLFGVFFIYLIINQNKAKLTGVTLKWVLAFAFLIFASQLHGFLFLSCILAYVGFYYMFYDWVAVNVKSHYIALLFINASAYCGIFGMNNLILYILDKQLINFSQEFYIFIICDSIISMFIFRNSKL